MGEYKYGAYGKLDESVAQSAVQSSCVPVYFGTAPINLIRNYENAGIINTPVKLTNFVNAQNNVGYAKDWNTFSLCEAIAAHFNNSKGNIGPIYVINVLNPNVHRKSKATTVNLAFTNGKATIKSSTIILDTLAIESKAEKTDYVIDYNYTKGLVTITSIGQEKMTGTIAASYFEVDASMITVADVIGGVTAAGEYSGIGALQLLYSSHFAVANLLAAPGWSEKPEVYNALVNAASDINGHWDAFVIADIPLTGSASTKIDTITKAKNWASENGYNNENSKVYWPQAKDSLGNIYHLSTLAVVELMRADESHDSVPFETCGNKTIPIAAQYFGEGVANKGFDQIMSKELTSNGISTCVFWGGNWSLWGDHTAAYKYGADIDPRAIFDVNIRMLHHITNSFQREWGTVIDEPFTKQLRDRILNREQEKLDSLVAMGALIGHPEIMFLESENSITDMMNGDFRWDISATPTPPTKSATVYVAYTDAGFKTYYEKE